MRWLTVLLVIVNVALGAYLLLQNTRPNPDAQIVNLQMNADKVRVIPEPPRPDPQLVERERTACLTWGSFDALEIERVREALSSMELAGRLSAREKEVTTNWWVYIPPQRSRANMERKANELRDLGVVELVTIPEQGRWQFAIALGAFQKEAGARSYLEQLRKLGVRSAVVEQREQKMKQTTLTIRAPSTSESARLVELAVKFPGSEMQAGECQS
jgi:hypothetical protein